MKGIIYIHRNKINGKCYVGQTVREPEMRWMNGQAYLYQKKDGTYKQPKFANAIIKYGWDNFEHLILYDIYSNQDELDAAEIATIAKYDSFNNGYNCTSGGHGGSKFSEETKKKMSKAKKGKKPSKAARKKMSEARKGKHWYTNNELDGLYFEGEQPEGWLPGQSISRRAAISENKKGQKRPEETKKKISEAQKGKKLSEEHRRKLSEAHKGKPSGNKGKKMSEESKRKMSEGHKQPVVVTDIISNEKTSYSCIKDFADLTGIKVSTCRGAKQGGHLLKKRYYIK